MIRLKDILKEITISDPTDTLVPGRSYKVGYGLKPLQYMGRTNKGHTFYRPDGSAEYRSDSQVELGLKNGVIRLMLPGERLDEISIGFGYDELINSFPGHARQKNPVDSPQYQWYVKAVDFVQSTNNIHQAAEVVKFFQNDFLGMDYDDRDSDEEMVKWWLSDEEQSFIRDELNTGASPEWKQSGVRKHMREITVSSGIQSVDDLQPGEKYDIMMLTKYGVELELQKGESIDLIWRRDSEHLEFVRIDENPLHAYRSGHMGPERIKEPIFIFKGINVHAPRPRDNEEVIFSKSSLEQSIRDHLIRVSTK